jgi:very-short-patch-repair endonuclease
MTAVTACRLQACYKIRMEWIALVVLIAAVFVAALLKRSSPGVVSWPLKPKPVLSVPEQKLYWRLIEALPESVVLAQVQLSRMLQIDVRQGRQAILNRIDRKSADFVVCSKDLQPRVVVELDDASHAAAARRKADADKDAAVRGAGLHVVRFNVKSMPSIDEIRTAIAGEVRPAGVPARGSAGGGTG